MKSFRTKALLLFYKVITTITNVKQNTHKILGYLDKAFNLISESFSYLTSKFMAKLKNSFLKVKNVLKHVILEI